MVKKLVVSLVFAGVIWAGTIGLADNKTDPKRTEVIYPDGSKAVVGDKTKARYEVTEKYTSIESEEADRKGVLKLHSYGTGYSGPNSQSGLALNSETVAGYSAITMDTRSAKTSVKVDWKNGKENASEPSDGVNIYYHHNSTTYAEAAGAGVKDWIGTSYAKAEAKTQGPGGGTSSRSEANAPLIGLKCDPSSQSATYTVRGAKNGHKDFITAETSGTASSTLFGTSSARANAQVKWEAELNKEKKEKKDEK